MKKRVLIFDDDPDILLICRIVLNNIGFEVLTLNNSTMVLQNVREYKPVTILIDNWLPGLNGIEAIRLLKNTSDLQNIPIIFFTATMDAENISKKAGADYFLRKPFDVSELGEIVQKATRGIDQNIFENELALETTNANTHLFP